MSIAAAPVNDPLIRFENAEKRFSHFIALKEVSLTIATGETVVICGPSGSGKSTLLRCMNGLERISDGTLTVLGKDIKEHSRLDSEFRSNVGMVFQRFSLYPHMNVLGNLTLAPVKVRGMSKKLAAERAMQLLHRVGMSEKASSYPSELSGGQSQRVAIARALIMDPKILLFDEPTSALDPEMIREVLDVMRGLKSTGMTVVVVTHEMGFAREMAERIVFMDEGRLVEDKETEDFFGASGSERAQKFLEKVLHH